MAKASSKARTKDQTKGVFCLEAAHWDGKKDPTSVEPMLRLLECVKDVRIPYEHHTVATKSELQFWLEHYLAPTYKTHPLLYLAFHGGEADESEESGIWLPENKWVLLPELAQMMEGRCANRIIHFGSCGVMNTSEGAKRAFLRTTKAQAVSGYQKSPYWIRSAAFDMLLLTQFQNCAFNRRDSINKVNDDLQAIAPGLYKHVDYQLVTPLD